MSKIHFSWLIAPLALLSCGPGIEVQEPLAIPSVPNAYQVGVERDIESNMDDARNARAQEQAEILEEICDGRGQTLRINPRTRQYTPDSDEILSIETALGRAGGERFITTYEVRCGS